jgi:hypothetical protein
VSGGAARQARNAWLISAIADGVTPGFLFSVTVL